MKVISLLLLFASCAFGQTIFITDFESEIPDAIDPGTATLTGVQGFAGLGPAASPFAGTFLRSSTGNVVKLELADLPEHTRVNVGFLLAAIDSLDGSGTYLSGDFFHIKMDGVTIFRESLANAVSSQVQSYVPAPGALLARRQDLGFAGPGGFFTDSAYDFAQEPQLRNIPHQSSSLTLEFVIEGEGIQILSDESWAIDNLVLSISNTPGPQQIRLDHFKVTYPVDTVPYCTCVLNGAPPSVAATLQASTDLGGTDPWEDLASGSTNANGSASFTNVPDPSAAGSHRNFYRVIAGGE